MMWLLSIILSAVDRLSTSSSSDEVIRPLEEESHRRASRCCGVSLSRFVGRVLGLGRVPRHLALILDGNRRFAVKVGLEKKSEGHSFGFEKLHEALEWCFDSGVQAVSVFAFSIDNFKRPREEVDALMALAQDKFAYLLSRSEMMRRNQVVIRVWGDWSLIPPTLLALVSRVVRESSANRGPTLNICFPYTSSHEVAAAARALAADGAPPVSVESFEKRLFSGGDHPEMLIRTSGEARLSDFMCWQTGHAQFHVYDCLWPEFSLFHFVVAVLAFRYHLRVMSSNY